MRQRLDFRVAREAVSPDGKAVAVDLDVSLIEVRAPNLELRRGDIVASPVERGAFDLVTARAVLHHVGDIEAAIKNLVASARPAARSYSLNLTFFRSASPIPSKSELFGTAGLHGRANMESITTSDARLRRGSRRSD
jgi:SAM-dependent methyltransferase